MGAQAEKVSAYGKGIVAKDVDEMVEVIVGTMRIKKMEIISKLKEDYFYNNESIFPAIEVRKIEFSRKDKIPEGNYFYVIFEIFKPEHFILHIKIDNREVFCVDLLKNEVSVLFDENDKKLYIKIIDKNVIDILITF